MKERIFIGTGFRIALFDKRDTNHFFAKDALGSLLRNSHLYMSDFILFETLTYLNCSVKRHDIAVRFLTEIRKSPVTILAVENIIFGKWDMNAKSSGIDLISILEGYRSFFSLRGPAS